MYDKVSEIQIIPLKPKNGLIALANFTYDNAFHFSSIGIYTRPHGGYRLTYPTRTAVNSSISLFHPINKEIAVKIEKAVIEKYEEIVTSTFAE